MNKNWVLVSILIMGLSYAQQTQHVDFLNIRASLEIVPDSNLVKGSASYTFKILKPVDSIFIDAKNISIYQQITDDSSSSLPFFNDGSKIWIKNDFKADSVYIFNLHYEVVPKQTLYFFKRQNQWNIWTQGQGKYTSHWLPSIDDVNDKIEFDLTFVFEEDYTILSNGEKLTKGLDTNMKPQSVRFKMDKPMSSYLVALAIGKYHKKTEISASGIPLEFYYYPEDSLKFESAYRYRKQMFDFLESEIGVAYPWKNYKQVPVYDFLYAGMENTTLTIFSDRYMVDDREFLDRNYVNVNAHELAHQWFGNLVTAESGMHHWLQEGFATYYALLAEREVFGDDYFYWQLYEYAKQLKAQQEANSATALINEKASSLTFYQKGAVVLHLLRTKIGDNAFKEAVKNYLNNYAFSSAESGDFIREIEDITSKNFSEFFNKWLYENTFDYDVVLEVLKTQSTLIADFESIDCEVFQSKCKDYLSMPLHPKIKAKIVSQVPELIKPEHFKSDYEVRLSIVSRLNNISTELKPYFEALLEDASYLIVEQALYKLWINFPDERSKYLEATKDLGGNNNYNIRLLWLVLSLNTVDYLNDLKPLYLNELVTYTSEDYHFETREAAFNYLNAIGFWNETAIQNLKLASNHPNWRFRTAVKNLLEALKTQELYKQFFTE